MIRKVVIPLLCVCCLTISCVNKQKSTSLRDVEITIDWLPVAEYYGIYYAKESGIFKKYGYNVTIKTQNGAPIVANLVGTGTIPVGTTTSDDILRSCAKKHSYSAVRKLFNFNPASIISLKEKGINSIDDLRGKTLGVNVSGNPYLQLKSLIETRRDITINMNSFKEYPIGYGGAEFLFNKNVDAFLGYTTNHALDVLLQDSTMTEVFLGDYGAYSYGLVLAFADEKALRKFELDKRDVQNFTAAVLEGYDAGYKDIKNSIMYLKEVEPTLDDKKLEAGILKIGILNRKVLYPHSEVDLWQEEISSEVRLKVLDLYNNIIWSGKE